MYDVLVKKDLAEVTAIGEDLEVEVHKTVAGTTITFRQRGAKGMINVINNEFTLDLTAQAHATLVAAMQLASRYYLHKKIKTNGI